jgi:hypothetical protein
VEHLVGAVLDIEFLLQGMTAAELDTAAAQHGVAADIEILLDNNDRSAVIARRNGSRQTGGAGADDDHIGGKIPFHWAGPCGDVQQPAPAAIVPAPGPHEVGRRASS